MVFVTDVIAGEGVLWEDPEMTGLAGRGFRMVLDGLEHVAGALGMDVGGDPEKIAHEQAVARLRKRPEIYSFGPVEYSAEKRAFIEETLATD